LLAAPAAGVTGRSAFTGEASAKLPSSPTLDHLLGVAEFFTTLHTAGHSPGAPPDRPGRAGAGGGAELSRWWSEARTAEACGRLVRPDRYGEWTATTPGGLAASVRFFYEHDTGTETLARLVAKLDRYEQLAAADIAAPILFGLPSRAREENLHRAITRRYRDSRGPRGLTVATTYAAPPAGTADPSGAVWWAVGATSRRRLAALPTPTPPDPWDRTR
jgi:hypothetical protein